MSNSNSLNINSRASTGSSSQQSTLVSSSTAQPSEAFRNALDAFRRRLSAEEEIEFKNTTYELLRDDIISLQQKQEKRKEMMNFSRIQAFLEGMQHLGKTIEIFLNVSNVVAFVWGPIKFLLLTAATYADSFELLLEAYEKLGESLPLLSEYESLFGDSPHMVEALEWIYLDILKFHQHAIRFFQGGKWKRIFHSIWKNFDTEFTGILNSLRRHKDLVERRASLSQFHRYQIDMLEIKTKLDEVLTAERKKKLLSVKEWLAVSSQTETDQVRFNGIRREYSTTSKWILDREHVKHWIEADVPTTPLLWIYGIPGAGKTILASAIVEECKQRPGFVTCFFYCHDGDQYSNSELGILKGLIDQLLDQYPAVLPPCYTRRGQSGEPSLRSTDKARKLFDDCCSMVPKLFVIIDGLDECEQVERKQAIDNLMKIVGQCDTDVQGKLRILFVSQDYADIRKALHTNAATRMIPKILPLSDLDTGPDIRTYVKCWVDKIAINFPSPKMTEDLKDYLRNLTVANAKGMFLYAELVMQNLYHQLTLEDLFTAITTENFPKGLEEAYERILQRIRRTSNRNEWNKAKRLLGWMVCAKRQLTWKEIQVALSINTETQEIDYDDRHLRKHIYEICGSLVLLSGDRVTLVHSTAKTYIIKIPDGIHEPSVECELAGLCLNYLTFPCFDVEGQDDSQLRAMMLGGHFAFQDYAVAKWFYHVNAMVKSGGKLLEKTETCPDIQNLLDNFSTALEDFMYRYDEEEWENGLVESCKEECTAFENEACYDNLLLLISHIYTFQRKGFEARHKISIRNLETALERNRTLLEEFPKLATTTICDRKTYQQFYSEERPYKCTKITCRYFSEGFKDQKARKKHVDIHDRPFQCEVSECLGAEGFANQKDLEKHIRGYHPEMTDFATTFKSATIKRAKADYPCTLCGKTFTRNFIRKNHERSHRGERPHECPECGRAFTRYNDMMRHKKLHERGRVQ